MSETIAVSKGVTIIAVPPSGEAFEYAYVANGDPKRAELFARDCANDGYMPVAVSAN